MKNYLSEAINLTGDSYINPRGALYSDGSGTHQRALSAIKSISIHHDAAFREHDYNTVDRIRSEAASHYNRLGPGLQYHAVIDNVGQIFYTRDMTTWLYVVGSSENTSCLAIKLDGNFETQQPTREQLESLYQLLEDWCENKPAFVATWPDVRPHCDYSSTACCGANLRNKIYAIQDKTSAQAQLLNQGEFDWPSLQPNAPTPPPPPAPQPPAPTPPTITINYRVIKEGKQIGAYSVEANAWNKYKAEGGSIVDQNNNDITSQLVAKYDPPKPPPVAVPPTDQTHDIVVENNNLLKQILKLLTDLITKIGGIFK